MVNSTRESDDATMVVPQQFANAIEALPVGFVLFDKKGNFVHCNKAQKDYYPHVADLYRSGTNRTEIIVRHAGHLSEKDPNLDTDEYIADRLDNILSARADVETQLSHGRWVQIRERTISDGGLVSIRTDISERKRVEADLRETRLELENHIAELGKSKETLERQTAELARQAAEQAALNAKLEHEAEIKDMFFAIVSHDLKNPFTPILGMSRLMADSGDKFSKEKLVSFAKGICTASEQYFDVLEKLLQWSRVQMAGVDPQSEKISLHDLASETFALLNSIALEKTIQLTIRDSKTTAYADAGMARSALQNLVTNALKFTPAGGAVEISSRERDNMVQVTVSDTGIGVPEEISDTLFSLGKKTASVGTGGETGSGLGLLVCKALVERNGGQIWFENRSGNGSHFHFTLPGNGPEPKPNGPVPDATSRHIPRTFR